MADLSGVLRKTIDGLPRATPQMREKVYEKARAAIQRQINAANPPLAEPVVSARLAALEDAITRTEEHYVAQETEGAEADGSESEAAAPIPQAPQPAPSRVSAEPQAQPLAPAAGSPAEPPREKPAASQTGRVAPTAPEPRQPLPQPQQPQQQPSRAQGVDDPRPRSADGQAAPSRGEPRQTPRPQQPVEPAESANPRQSSPQTGARLPAATMPAATGAAAAASERQAPAGRKPGPQAQPFVPPETEEPDAGDGPPSIAAPFITPGGRGDRDGESKADARERGKDQDRATDDRSSDDRTGERVPDDIRVDDHDIPEADITAPRYPNRRPKRSGQSGKIAVAAVVILLLGAVGTTVWAYRDQIENLLVGSADIGTIADQSTEKSGSVGGQATSDKQAATADKAVQSAANKTDSATATRRFTQRLLPDGSEVDPGPADKTANAFDEGTNVAAATSVDQNGPQPGATPTLSSEIGKNPSVVGGNSTPADGQSGNPPATMPAPQTNGASVQTGNQLAVGQNVIFYQERTKDQPVTKNTGTVVWSLVDEPGADGKPGEPAIKAVADVPEQNVKMTMTIKRNTDPTLPASHVIELEFDVPKDFSGGSVANVQSMRLKESEEARGEKLIGVAGKISDNYFIIALNNLDDAVKSNLSLLQNQKWIDIPLAYSTGRRALISIEKGIPGDRVFKQAIDAWNKAKS
ncbi:hypothetical protein LQ948_08725 [Jiella sp. MQZ9-1]|uniref:Uncharacterized protein n=1 Tax=Jiella flava TaxID=2816857 RepID=A0A939FVX7_9HYPH|nr:hypothetical protein [Jiella flava]MBO0662948.1 hypothetical protein [Jiella flava]MCD2471292.1 hypothetical protein [Jiella flava]